MGWVLVLLDQSSSFLEVMSILGDHIVKRSSLEVDTKITKIACLEGRTFLAQSCTELSLCPLPRLLETETPLKWCSLTPIPFPCTDFCLSKAGGLISLVFASMLTVLRLEEGAQSLRCLCKIALGFTPWRVLQGTGDRFVLESCERTHLVALQARTELAVETSEDRDYFATTTGFVAVDGLGRAAPGGQGRDGPGGKAVEGQWWAVQASLFACCSKDGPGEPHGRTYRQIGLSNEHFDWEHLQSQPPAPSFARPPQEPPLTATPLIPSHSIQIAELKLLAQHLKASSPTSSELEQELLLLMATKRIEPLMFLLKVAATC
jgi:hypothetical protein